MLKIAKDLFDLIYPIGTYYETSDGNWTPSNAGWYGTWTREDDGTILASKKSSGAFNKTIGTIVGEETHKLTESEIPSHTHSYNKNVNPAYETVFISGNSTVGMTSQGGGYGLTSGYASIGNTGGNQAHNNIQPSKVCIRWHRTA